MTKNRIRGKPKKKTNRVRDSDILKKINKDIEELTDKGVKYLKENKKKLIPYVIFACIGNKLSFLYRSSEAAGMIAKLSDTISSLDKILALPLLSMDIKDILAGIITALVIRLLLYIKMQDEKNFRKGEEYGSASFGSAKDIEPFIDWENPYNNLLLSDTERLSMNPRMKDPTTNRNKNVLIVGGSGSGKTRGHVKPNLMQTFGSYIVTDPKGYLCVGQ
ncbi:MAG: type IV secretory system conjugative DNA transfer family protein [Lachnospiraceae bacterium]|nr:type IV secretory system conjugative DNA transfer family protein [Lachnospiraceae bacterium]